MTSFQSVSVAYHRHFLSIPTQDQICLVSTTEVLYRWSLSCTEGFAGPNPFRAVI
jgi:hypothetical protein